MFTMYLLIFKIGIYVYIAEQLGLEFSNEDCYESFNTPKLIFKLFHYNPSGPKFLKIQFYSDTEYLNESIIYSRFDGVYHFKKFDGKCEISPIFSTNGLEIKEMEITMKIYISTFGWNSVYMTYMFLNGFKSGYYLFSDEFSNFGILAKVIYSTNPFLPDTNQNLDERNIYLNSLKIDKTEICVITYNNRQVIIRPNYHEDISEGFIFAIKPSFKDIEYYAFECRAKEHYRYDTTVFITEEFYLSKPEFIALYAIWNGTDLNNKAISFSLDNINLHHYERLEYLPITVKKVFLMDKHEIYIYCHQGPHLTLYNSPSKNIYYAYDNIYLEVDKNVKKRIITTYSQHMPCGL